MLRKNLIASFVLILFFSLCFFISSYLNKKQAERLNNWVIHTHRVIGEINKLNTLITEFEALDQTYVIINNKDFGNDLNLHEVQASSVLNEIKNLTADNEIQQKNLASLIGVIQQKIKYRNNIFDLLNQSQQEALRLLANPQSKRLYEEIKGILASMLEVENSLLKKRAAKYQEAVQKIFLSSTVLELFALVILTIAFFKISEETRNRKIAEEEAQKSEAKYKGLIENSSLIIYTTDLQGRFTYISNKGLELTGYTMEELIGKPFYILISGNKKKDVARFYLNQYKDFVKDLTEEFEIKTKDKSIKVVQISAVLTEKNGKITGFQSTARDITQVKYVESLVRESKIKLHQQQEEYNFRLQSVINNIPMVLYIKDLEGRYVMVNRKFIEASGLRDDTIIGKTNAEIFKNEEKFTLYQNVDLRIIQTGKPVEFEEVVSTADGERNLLVTKFPLFDKNNEIFAISGVVKDITDMAHHRQQLIDARLKAEKAEQLQEAFLANMSHEIRTPMNGIMGMTNILLDTNLDSEQKEYAELIKRSSDALLILINDILDLSKIKAGRMELEAIDFNLKEAVQNVLQPMKVSLKKNVVLNYAINKAVPDCIRGDSHKLFQILNNLLSNAIKFTEKGEIKVDVNLIEKGDEKIYIKFDVSDTGIGISSEHIANIFESFTQAGNDTTRRFGGTGLGLAITKRLIDLQNGSIHVESTPGVGTVFHVEIPYLPASAALTCLLPDININLSEAIEDKRILIVEDNQVNQRVLINVLQKVKASHDIANNGQEAIEKLESGKIYNLIIMDLQMPVMDGFEATAYIRKKLKINTPIIAMTASTLRNERVKCFDIGMNEYLAKPFSPGELIKHIHHLINTNSIKEKQLNHQQMAAEKLYDLSYLQELDDNDYLIEMIELFFESTSAMLDEIRESIKKKDWDAVSRNAHKIKSSLGPFQINKMISIASAMEENAKQKKNTDEIVYLNKELHSQYNLIKPLIEEELAKAKKISNGFVIS